MLQRLRRAITQLPRQSRKLTSFTITLILKIDPVVGIDVVRRYAVALLQKRRQQQPGPHLLSRDRFGDVRIIADEFDANRVGFDHLVVGLGVVDVLVVVAVITLAMGRDDILRDGPIDRTVCLHP